MCFPVCFFVYYAPRCFILDSRIFNLIIMVAFFGLFNPLMPNDDYGGRTAPLTSKRCILYIYSTHIRNEYFKHGIYSPFFPLQNAVCFINLTYLVLYYSRFIYRCAKIKKIIPAPKG